MDGDLELTDSAFDQIFKVLDTNMDGQITREEMIEFITNFTKSWDNFNNIKFI